MSERYKVHMGGVERLNLVVDMEKVQDYSCQDESARILDQLNLGGASCVDPWMYICQ